jgi:hypothetical protein
MKSFTISALALMALSLTPALSHAEGHRDGAGARASEFGRQGYEQREKFQDVMRKRMDAMHSARAEVLDRADACLERAATADEAKACIRAERAETKALHEQMKAKSADLAQMRAAKHGERQLAPSGMPDCTHR